MPINQYQRIDARESQDRFMAENPIPVCCCGHGWLKQMYTSVRVCVCVMLTYQVLCIE
jgi:hypothetical protein